MPITKSAKKALRQSIKRRARNLKRKEEFKQAVKEVKKLVAAGKTKEAQLLIPKVYKALDKAAKTGAIKKNAAARRKSRIAKLIAKNKQ
ncbi:MAG: 30S ribosomal protein S20 [Candidatus Sungbacteria bacterium]|nr:30S ribosomal protein S20 [Candidatus Sungbacteria bacterium]